MATTLPRLLCLFIFNIFSLLIYSNVNKISNKQISYVSWLQKNRISLKIDNIRYNEDAKDIEYVADRIMLVIFYYGCSASMIFWVVYILKLYGLKS